MSDQDGTQKVQKKIKNIIKQTSNENKEKYQSGLLEIFTQ